MTFFFADRARNWKGSARRKNYFLVKFFQKRSKNGILTCFVKIGSPKRSASARIINLIELKKIEI